MVRHASAGSRSKDPSQRQLQIGETVRHALSELLAREPFRDPDLAGQSITVSEVRVSPDLRHAKAFVMPLGGGAAEVVLAGLRRAAPYINARLAQRLQLRRSPRLDFELDQSFDQANRIYEALRAPDVARDLVPGEVEEDDDDGRFDR